jgi:NADH-quinone oxidoreductase subunit G
VIATFEGRPWEGHHTGNVIELCPVGALTSTQYRFHGRPWETTDHPSIAPWDPCGSNVFNSVREGRVVRVLSREHADVDNGWIDDRTRFAYASMYGPDRILAPQQRPNRDRPVGNRPVVELSHEVAMEWLHGKLAEGRESGTAELWVLSGGETLEVVHAIQQLAAQTGGRVVAAPGASAAAPAGSARIADLGAADNILVIGDADLLDTAPGLELRIRKARQRGAVVVVAGSGGTRLEQAATEHVFVAPGGLDAYAAGPPVSGDAEQLSVAVYRDGDLSANAVAALAGAGFRLLAIPAAPNARGLAALGVECASWDEVLGHAGGVVYVGVDPDRSVDVSQWGPAVKRAAWVAAIDPLPSALHHSADLVVPAAWGGEQDGTLVNLEGRLQRTTVGAQPPGEVVPQLRWIAGLARRLGASVPGHAAGAYRQLAAAHGSNLPAATHGEIGLHGLLGVQGGPAPVHAPDQAPQVGDGQLALFVAPSLFDAPEVACTEAMRFLVDTATVHLNRADARTLGLTRGDHARVELDDGTSVLATIATSARIAPGHARTSAGHGSFAPGRTGWRAARVHAAPRPYAGAVGAATAVTGGEA